MRACVSVFVCACMHWNACLRVGGVFRVFSGAKSDHSDIVSMWCLAKGHSGATLDVSPNLNVTPQPARHHLQPRVPRDAFTPQPYSNEAKWRGQPRPHLLPSELLFTPRLHNPPWHRRLQTWRCVEKWSRPCVLHLKRGSDLCAGPEMTFDLA